jgi:hypothetical protein
MHDNNHGTCRTCSRLKEYDRDAQGNWGHYRPSIPYFYCDVIEIEIEVPDGFYCANYKPYKGGKHEGA